VGDENDTFAVKTFKLNFRKSVHEKDASTSPYTRTIWRPVDILRGIRGSPSLCGEKGGFLDERGLLFRHQSSESFTNAAKNAENSVSGNRQKI